MQMSIVCECVQDANEEAAPLFGRGDHAAREQALTVRDRCDLVVRATFLLTVFLPLLLLGPFLLLLASQFAPSAKRQAQAAAVGAGPLNVEPADQQVCCAVLCCSILPCVVLHAVLHDKLANCCAELCCAATFCAVLC